MIIDQSLLDTLSTQAKSSSRLRQNYGLRNSENDNSQRMPGVLEPGTVVPVHRHRDSSESIVVIRGKMVMKSQSYGSRRRRAVALAGGAGRGTVLFEANDGMCEPLGEEYVNVLNLLDSWRRKC